VTMDAGTQSTVTTAAVITAIVESEIIKGSRGDEDSNRIQVLLSEIPLEL
jgi:hypothetical protein